jgi:threonine dehydrogenase-like Zn-dependent dehydrogenase
MQTLVWEEILRLKDIPEPALQEGEVLVRVSRAGVCRTDLEVLKDYHGFRGVLGHEFVGVVAGPEGSPWQGRRVVGEITVACGVCSRCLSGLARHCRKREVLGLVGRNGAFAEYLALPAANLHAVPEQVPDDAAVFTEPLAAALAVLETGSVSPSHRVLVVGDGSLGLLIAMVLARFGAAVTLAGHYPEHLRLAAPYGTASCLEKELAAGDFDVVVEASGSPSGLDLALERVRPRGTVILKSTYAGRYPLDPADLVVPEVRLMGCRCGPFPAALRLLASGAVDPRPLIQARFPLARGVEALEHAGKRGMLKVILTMGDEDP